ncbi:MAG: class I SAM-dependent methyltransferase [Bacteroidota bacterium]
MVTRSDELTILEFELKHLAELVINNSMERWLPNYTPLGTHSAHFNRYKWVSQFVKDKAVLDLACGSGYGSKMLIEIGEAKSVLGGDLSNEVIDYCRAKHKTLSNLTFVQLDACKFNIENKFDLIVSFETIEHLLEVELFLANIKNSLKNKASFVLSTPISKKSIDHNPENPHHLIEWDIPTFLYLIEKNGFVVQKKFIQPYKIEFRPQGIAARIKRRVLKLIKKDKFKKLDDFSIIEMDKDTHLWQKQINDNKIGGYVILICKTSKI